MCWIAENRKSTEKEPAKRESLFQAKFFSIEILAFEDSPFTVEIRDVCPERDLPVLKRMLKSKIGAQDSEGATFELQHDIQMIADKCKDEQLCHVDTAKSSAKAPAHHNCLKRQQSFRIAFKSEDEMNSAIRVLSAVLEEGGSALDIKMLKNGASVSSEASSADNNYNASPKICQANILADIKNKLRFEEGDERPSSAPTT